MRKNPEYKCKSFESVNTEMVKEYNQTFHPLYESAICFLQNIPHAIEKTPDSDEAMKQLRCIGYNDKLVNFIRAALDSYRETTLSKLKNCKEYNIDKKTLSKAMQCLADNGIEPDECCTVLQAICYILLGIEIEDYIPEETLPGESF